MQLEREQASRGIIVVALVLIAVAAFASRLFAVIRFESVIHEFDPYFNFRSTKFLVENGFYEFYNWFDSQVWYPLGRIVGGTIYPGLMITSAMVYWGLHALNFAIELRNVCVFLAPTFAANTVIVTYFLGKEIRGRGAGLAAAALVGIVPGYISRSVAGSYDNEGVAIFAMLLVFYFFVKTVKTGSLWWSFCSVVAYYYMVNAWGGYIFIINLLPLYVLVMLGCGMFSPKLYIAYSNFYLMGTLMAMQVHFVGFQAAQSGEHMLAAVTFAALQVYGFFRYLRASMDADKFRRLMRKGASFIIGSVAAVFFVGVLTGYISPWTGRFWTLLDPTYAKQHIPIIASVSEHQPTTWSSFFFDLHFLTFLFPAGLYFLMKERTPEGIFLVMYGMASVYFAGVMVRLMLVLAPAMCLMGGVALSTLLDTWMAELVEPPPKVVVTKAKKQSAPVEDNSITSQRNLASVIVAVIFMLMFFYAMHCTWVTSEAYSSPSIVLAARGHGGQKIIFDDFREAYYWLRQNTAEDAKIMSWWDYGYQITAMSNRTVLVDNNTWNNTHIATVGKAMASDEETAYKIMRKLDVNYVLVIFGGLTGYSSDDINKFLWMVRIAGSIDPTVKEMDYYSDRGEYRIDDQASETMLNSLMYHISYYRFGEVATDQGKPTGYDRVRSAEIGKKDIRLSHLEEAFTSEHWIVRIYRVKPQDNRFVAPEEQVSS